MPAMEVAEAQPAAALPAEDTTLAQAYALANQPGHGPGLQPGSINAPAPYAAPVHPRKHDRH